MKNDTKNIFVVLFYVCFKIWGGVIKFRMVQMGRIYRNEIIEK